MKKRPKLRLQSGQGLTPFKIIASYALVAGTWILLMEEMLSLWVTDPPTLAMANHAQHLIFLAATAIMLYLLMRRYLAALRRSEQALRRSEARNQALLNAIPDLMLRIGKDGTYLDFKGARGSSRWFPMASMLGKKVREVLPERLAQKMETCIERAFERGKMQVFEYRMMVEKKLRYHEARIVVSWEDEVLVIVRDISARKNADEERERLIKELQEALGRVRELSGLLPICASCKSIRDDKGYWTRLEAYLSEHSKAEFSHGICPDCARKLYPDHYKPQDQAS
jgi:PAS domain S-box-containing protein